MKGRYYIMPAYYDKTAKKWYCKFYYTDYTNTKRQKLKRGFTAKREALEYERTFLVKYQADPTILFKDLVSSYMQHAKQRVKEYTYTQKAYLINAHVLPYFENYPINKIDNKIIEQWHNELLEKDFSKSYLSLIHTELSAVFTYATKYYGLLKNPAQEIGAPKKGKEKKRITIWTHAQFNEFIKGINNPMYSTLFYLLFYTGMRIGEALALTWDDISFEDHTISINKTYNRINKKDVITSPKTRKSVRSITIFPYLEQILAKYKKGLYGSKNDRIFNTTQTNAGVFLRKYQDRTGLPYIRVHDLRHSHVSMLVELGFNPVAIAERLGHESIKITLDTYSHLYPNKQDQIANKLQEISSKNVF